MRQLLTGLVIGAALTAATAYTMAPPANADTWALVSEDASGNVFVHDTGMSLRDCRTAPDNGNPVQWCEREQDERNY